MQKTSINIIQEIQKAYQLIYTPPKAPNLNLEQMKTMQKQIVNAINMNDLGKIDELIDLGIDFKKIEVDKRKLDLVLQAVYKNNLAMVKKLVTQGLSLIKLSPSKLNAFDIVCQNDNVEMFKYLKEQNFSQEYENLYHEKINYLEGILRKYNNKSFKLLEYCLNQNEDMSLEFVEKSDTSIAYQFKLLLEDENRFEIIQKLENNIIKTGGVEALNKIWDAFKKQPIIHSKIEVHKNHLLYMYQHTLSSQKADLSNILNYNEIQFRGASTKSNIVLDSFCILKNKNLDFYLGVPSIKLEFKKWIQENLEQFVTFTSPIYRAGFLNNDKKYNLGICDIQDDKGNNYLYYWIKNKTSIEKLLSYQDDMLLLKRYASQFHVKNKENISPYDMFMEKFQKEPNYQEVLAVIEKNQFKEEVKGKRKKAYKGLL